MTEEELKIMQMATTVRQWVNQMIANGRADVALQAIGMPNLELLQMEAARTKLSRLLITSDYRFFLIDYNNREVEMSPIHKALYLLFLNNPEGIESKHLSEHRDELLSIYMRISSWLDVEKVHDVVDRLVERLQRKMLAHKSRLRSNNRRIHSRLLRNIRTQNTPSHLFITHLVRTQKSNHLTPRTRGLGEGVRGALFVL